MGMVSLGPFAFPSDVFAALVAILVFMGLSFVLARYRDSSFDRWSNWALIVGLIAARLAYVVVRPEGFLTDPKRIFMFWQGGFEWLPGVIVAALLVFLLLKSAQTRLVAFGVLAISLGVWQASSLLLQDTRYGQPLPDISLLTLAGQEQTLDVYQTGPVVVNLWATWCPPCRRELPVMQQTAEQNPQVNFLFVNQAEPSQIVNSYLQEQNLQLEQVLLDPNSSVAQAFETVGLPITLFFYDNQLRHVHAGEISQEALAEAIQDLKS